MTESRPFNLDEAKRLAALYPRAVRAIGHCYAYFDAAEWQQIGRSVERIGIDATLATMRKALELRAKGPDDDPGWPAERFAVAAQEMGTDDFRRYFAGKLGLV